MLITVRRDILKCPMCKQLDTLYRVDIFHAHGTEYGRYACAVCGGHFFALWADDGNVYISNDPGEINRLCLEMKLLPKKETVHAGQPKVQDPHPDGTSASVA